MSSSKNRDMLSANLMENMHSIPIMECVVWLLQYLVIIVICVGVVFTLIFHVGTKESSTGEASDASGRELSLSVRRRMYVRCWLKTPQFYIVSLRTGHHFKIPEIQFCSDFHSHFTVSFFIGRLRPIHWPLFVLGPVYWSKTDIQSSTL